MCELHLFSGGKVEREEDLAAAENIRFFSGENGKKQKRKGTCSADDAEESNSVKTCKFGHSP